MKYDFTTMPDRGGKDALAVDAIGANVSWGTAPTAPKASFSKIPMWVADMNFATVPTIPQKIIQRAEHPLYGYYIPTDEYYNSIIRWHELRNGVSGLSKEYIGYENGVLGCVTKRLPLREKRCSFTARPISALPMYWRIPAESQS